MRKFLYAFIILLVGFSAKVYSQTYGNEWITYSQSYYKVYVSSNGFCRLNYNALVNAGVPLGSIDPRSVQIFNKGEEQYIYVKGENDGVFNAADYIEFYGEKNDGTLDTPLYKGINGQANKTYSLFSDSAVYFITWNSSVSNRRIIIDSDINFNAYTPVPYMFKTSRQNYTSQYFAGETNSIGITDPDYTACEGWFDNGFNLGQSATKYIPTGYKYGSGPHAEVEFVVVGASNYSLLNPDHHLRINYLGNTLDTLYDGYKTLKFSQNIPVSQIGTSNTDFTFSSINDLGSGSDRNTVAYIQIKYPHTLNLEGTSTFWFQAQNAPQVKSLFNFTNFNVSAGDTARLYDITNHRMIKVVYDGSFYKCLLPNSIGEKNCVIFANNSIKNITKIYPVGGNAKFVNYKAVANIDFSDYFIITHQSLWDEAENYKDYRNLTGFHAMIIDVDHLYDQFAYGIVKSPLSIRNFIRFAYNNFTVRPKDVFLIGKGYRAATDGSYPAYRNSTFYNNLTLVPSFGYPPSDNLFSQGIVDTLYEPAIPIGRLSARNPQQVNIYLQKVMQYEAEQANPKEWMKTILHFGGGSNTTEQQAFTFYLNNYKDTIQGPFFGGNVKTFLKTSSAPIQINQSDSLKTLINNGVSIMTFFGHASGIGFDQSIDNPSEYNNYGKYPFLLANSCYAGDMFQYNNSSSEEFVLIENKGVIAYLASISLGVPYDLNTYSQELYNNISKDCYGKSIGEIIKKTIGTIETPDLTLKETCLTMMLHGDPSLKINSFEKPDYVIDVPDVYFNPLDVTSELDSFNIVIVSTNIGRAVVDSFIIQTIHTFPDGTTSTTQFNQIQAPYFKDTLTFKLPVDLSNSLGLNKFKITLDFYNEIDELSELNNSVEVTLFIKSSEIVPVFPYKYAVTPVLPVTLKASTGFPFIGSETYEFQMDTTDNFNSPVLQTGHITHLGGVISWTPSFPVTSDSIVYFWRVSVDSGAAHNSYNWRESSFQYIQGKSGWGQAHFYQFKNDKYQYVNYNRTTKKFGFVNNLKSLTCQTGFYQFIAWNEEWYRINNVEMAIWSSLGEFGNGVLVAVFDSISAEPWKDPQYSVPVYRFDISTSDSLGKLKLFNLLNSIPNNDHVLVYSHRNHNAQSFNNALYSQFESFGSAKIRTLNNNIPYIIFGKKGGIIGSAHEVVGTTIGSKINLADTLFTKWTQGYIQSELIGPATKWSSLHWHQKGIEVSVPDYVSLSVIGIRLNGQVDTLIKNLPPDSADVYNLYTRIDAKVHPYLKLLAKMEDDSLHTPPQMKRWQVLFEGAPETAIDPSLQFTFHADTIQEGDNIMLSAATHNISLYPMDSLLIKYWIVDKSHVVHPLGSFRHRPHPAGDVLIDTIKAATTGLEGLNSLWIEVNPDNDQLEQTHFNNVGEKSFFVTKDKTNPLLDVTFDGVHILDGDIVSAKPEIQISLKDENKFLALNDTAKFRVYLVKPETNVQSRVYFISLGQEIMQFIPASLPNNSCRILYKGDFPTDGVYKLIVEAQDISHNESGTNEYSISFEVINKPSITHVMNWPNPFNNATHFVFTLTGSEIPTYFKIQIMTITGKVVREIDLPELGPIHIGRNITDYAWNGTDEFGDRLANGVYLYRVITRLNENTVELKQTQADQYFKKEFGKMYLLGN
jgi:hypothetical protein